MRCSRSSSPLVAQVELIVSGDDDLFVLGSFEGIPIVNAAEALRLIGEKASASA